MLIMVKIGSVDFNLFLAEGYNNPHTNERMIEVPLARWFIEKHNHAIVEIGAVTPYYGEVKHEVIDPNDPWPGCIKKGVSDFSYENKNVLSISTVEHVGFTDFCPSPLCQSYDKEKDSKEAREAVDLIRKAQSYLITWPAGYHEGLDEYVAKSEDTIMLKRVDSQSWCMAADLTDVKFMFPWNCGNGLYIVTNCNELLIDK